MKFRLFGLALLAGALLTPTTTAGAAPGDQGAGNPVLTVGPTTLPADRVSEVTVTGTDYLVPPHAPGVDVFGGVYVFFGWVSDPNRFGPSIRSSTSNDGNYGVTYAYPGDGGDPGTRDDGTGSMRLVSFTAGGESGQATDFHMDDHGNWTTTLHIYGSTFTTTNPSTGETRSYDCQQVQCGVMTMGAHGNASATNEKFTPLNFTGSAPATPITPGGSGRGAGGGSGGAGGGSGSSSGEAGGGTEQAGGDIGGGAGSAGDPSSAAGAGSDVTTATSITEAQATAEDGDGPPVPGEDEVLAIGISSTRDTGGPGAALLLAAVAVVAVGMVGGVRWRRRRTRTQPRTTPALFQATRD